MKKKIIAVSLIIAMMAITVVGGTMAYFFDTDSEVNTFTVGNVEISLEEKGEDNKTDFEQEQKLWPGADPTAKRAWIKNTGDNEAWVWAEIWIPEELDAVDDASSNSLHFNYYGQFTKGTYDEKWTAKYSQSPITDGIVKNDADHSSAIDGMVAANDDTLWTLNDTAKKHVADENGVFYNVYTFKMEKTLAAGMISLPFLRQVYMDAGVTQCTDAEHNKDGKICLVLKDGRTHYTGSWEVIVKAYAMQAEGFDSVDEAIAAYEAQNPTETTASSEPSGEQGEGA